VTVSSITGQRQGPWLRATTWIALALGGIGSIVPGTVGTVAAGTAIAVVTATPLLRVVWVIIRLVQERDLRFVYIGIALLTAVILGVAASMSLRV
jgi:uncharacterized membrane protein